MTMQYRFANQDDGIWVMSAAGALFNATTDRVAVAGDLTQRMAGVVWSSFYGGSIACHVRVDNPRGVTRDLVWMMFHFPFMMLHVNKLFAPIVANNEACIDRVLRMGFFLDARLTLAGPYGEDLLIYAITPHEARRWLAIKPQKLRPPVQTVH